MENKLEVDLSELPFNRYEQNALGKQCFLCSQTFDKEKIEKSKSKNKFGIADIPVRTNGIPGFVHRSCRKKMNDQLLNTSFDHHAL